MNTKLSGAELQLVPITRIGRNFFPFVEHLNRRVIKYIDFAPASLLPDVTDTGCTTDTNMFVTIFNEYGTTEIHRYLPLENLNYQKTLGIRTPIFQKIKMSDCFIDCQNSAAIGTTVALVFWYDLPEYSARNSKDTLITDSISIPISNITRYNALPDSDRMTGKRFRKLLLGVPTTTPDQNNGVAVANLSNIYLTLKKGTYKVLSNLPIQLLYQLQILEKQEFQNIIFDFQSSYLTIGGAGTATSTDYVGKYVYMNLQYEA